MMEKEIIVIFGDISNAFDRVWQKGLLYKLKSIGMDDTVLKIKSCGTFASRKASSNVSHPCGLKYFLFRSTSLTKSTTLLPLTVSALYFCSPFSLQAMLGSAFIFRTNSSALVFIVFGTLSNISSSITTFVSVYHGETNSSFPSGNAAAYLV